MAALPYILAVLIGGAALGVQAPTNALLARHVGSPVNAALVSFAVGAVGLALAALVLQARPEATAVRSAPWYAWVGGLYGAMLVAAAACSTPRLGAAVTLSLAVVGQLVAALALDHFGLLGVARHPVSGLRIGGFVLVVGGAFLMRRG